MTEFTGQPLDAKPDADGIPGLTEQEREVLKKVFSSPMDIPQEWKAWLVSYLEANPPVLPISQIFGFTDFTANYAEIVSADTQSSGSYANLNFSVGPTLDNLSKGRYLIMFGCKLSNTASAAENYVSLSVNGGAATDDDSAMFGSVGSTQASVSRAVIKSLTEGSNSLQLKYRNSGGITMTAARRWLIALKVQNL